MHLIFALTAEFKLSWESSIAKHWLGFNLSFFNARRYISGFGFKFLTNFEFPIKLKFFWLIDFLNEKRIELILFFEVEVTKASLIFSLIQRLIIFLTPGLNFKWFFFK